MSRIDELRAEIQRLIRERETIISDYTSQIASLQKKLVDALADEVRDRLFVTLDAEGDASISAGGPRFRIEK